jgi:hypothetical protein
MFGQRPSRRRPPRRGSFGYGSPFGRPRPRSRTGFFGPFPYYSRETRGGGRVSVSGCCLPIALAFPASGVLALRALLRR